MKAIQIREYGAPSILETVDVEKPVLAEGEVLIKVSAIGGNYADTARREGEYVVPTHSRFLDLK